MTSDNITTTAVTCSACGETYTDILELQEFYEVAFFGGYASIFGDGAHVYGDFCQACIKRLLGEYLEVTQPKDPEELSYSDEALTIDELTERMDALFAHRNLWQRFLEFLRRIRYLLRDIVGRIKVEFDIWD